MSTQVPSIKELFKAGAHFGHHKERTDARTHPYVFGYKNKISIINLEKTREMLEDAVKAISDAAANGGMFLFVGTKMQAKDKVREIAKSLGQPYIIERWPGGLLTNYQEVSKSIKRMKETEAGFAENKFEHLTKRERLEIERNLSKTKIIFGGLNELDRKPAMVIIVDAKEEMNALLEAKKAGVKVVALCDTNSNPKMIDFPIILNDDSKSTINLVLDLFAETIKKNHKEIAEPEEKDGEQESSGKPENGKDLEKKNLKAKE